MTNIKIAPSDMSKLRVIAYLESRGEGDYAREIAGVISGKLARDVADILIAGGKSQNRLLADFAEELRGSVDVGPKSHRWYIEPTKDGSFAVKKGGAKRASAIGHTQTEAISIAREMDASAPIHVERVRSTKTGTRDKWRKP